jgi:hypothetical protein
VKKNRRYSSSPNSRRRSAPINRIALSVTLIGCVVVAMVCGQALDQRQRIADAGLKAEWGEGRASLMLPRTEQESKELTVRARVERVSGVSGRPLLSTERWQASEPVLVDGLDVSDMFVQPFTLKRSLQSGFRTEGVTLEVAWERPETFLDLGIGQTSNGAVMLRFRQDSVQSFLRSHSGILIPGEKVAGDPLKGCERYEVSVAADDVSVLCAGRKIIGVAYPGAANGQVFVASNLEAREVGMLSIKGTLGAARTEDNA